MKDAAGGSGTQGRHHSPAPSPPHTPPSSPHVDQRKMDLGLWMMHAPEETAGHASKHVCHEIWISPFTCHFICVFRNQLTENLLIYCINI